MGTATSKKRAMRSKRSGVKNFIRTNKNIQIVSRLLKELKS
jgi:hypothetical protein